MQNLADAESDILADLNPQQLKAVTSENDALLILSGAGTGKTKVITTRIVYLLNNFLAYSGQILAVTFSNRAAFEMQNRVRAMTSDIDGIWLGTFHAICARILRKHAALVGLTNSFTILDSDDQIKLAKQILVDQNRDKKLAPLVVDIISRCKDKCITADQVDSLQTLKSEDVRFYKSYQAGLLSYNSVDFSDLILYVIRIFQEHQDILDYYRDKFKYILVDEYQDTNMAQYMLLRLLSPYGKGLCCVGDDDQSIYSWRGAEIGNILRFERDFPNATVLKLEQNYRSTGHILEVANSLISKNEQRHDKRLWTDGIDGHKVIVARLQTGYDEARYVARQIQNVSLRNSDISYKDMAILVRAGYQTREFEDTLLQANIPYRVVGGPKFYERAEIKDMLAYMRLVHQPADGLAFERIVNKPKHGIGEAIVKKLHEISESQSCNLFQAAEYAVENNLIRPSARTELKSFLNMIKDWRDKEYSPATLVKIIAEDSGYIQSLSKEVDAEVRKENINELINALENYTDIETFLEHVNLVADNRAFNDENVVSIMTLHSSKGMEFSTVFLCGMEEGIFPHSLSLRDGSLEEERRLAYVGITRTKDILFLTYACNRNVHGQWQSNPPSRFLSELPKEHIIEVR